MACVWNIWLHRNLIAFQGAQPSVAKVIDGAKAHSWFWSKNLGKGMVVSFLDWSMNFSSCY